MSNGIVSRIWPVAVVGVFLLSGCARDRANYAGSATAHQHGTVALEPQSTTPTGKVATTGNAIEHKLCPVTGEPLDSMGGAIPVTVENQTLFVCCRGCVKKVKSDPEKYFAIARSE